MSYHNTSSPTANAQRLATNAQGQSAPAGYHYMPDGTLMADAEHGVVSSKVIRNLDLNLSDLPYASEVRQFTISGDNGAQFILEIKSGSNFYNFTTNTFQAAASRLEKTIASGSYKGSITFPTVATDGQYDIYLYAVPGTTHAAYREVRFGDGSLDVNNSSGSNSLMMQKVIYQYATIDLTISSYSPNGAIIGVNTNAVISTSRGKSKAKTPFSCVFTAGSGSGYAVRVLKQPSSSDVLAFIQPVVGAAPVTLPGENIYPAVTTAAIDTVGGGTRVDSVSGSTVTMFIAPSLMSGPIKVGDRIHCAARSGFASSIVTVTATSISPTKTFVMSQTAASLGLVANDVLSFSNQMNYSWPVTNFADKIKAGMMVVYGGVKNVTVGTVVNDYYDTITIFEDTEKEQVIVKNKIQAVDTKAQKPTIVKGLVTVQPGDITFNKQQVLALAGNTLQVGGYGESEILRVFGWDVRFTDLKVTLTAPTTTTSGVVTNSATIGVNHVEGVINNVSRVRGIGINPALQNPLITGGGGATGSGDWTADAAQTLENGITLTIENTGRIATITGNIEIIKAGTASQTLRFDLEKFLSDTA
jgi:hypothetical protein